LILLKNNRGMPGTLALGIDIGGTNTKGGLVDLDSGEVLCVQRSPTEKKDPDRFMDSLVSLVDTLKNRGRTAEREILGIGIGVSSFVYPGGLVDSTYGFQEFMEDFPLADRVEERCGLTCRVDNDARVVALGEALFGAGRGSERVLMLTLGTGLGVGFVAGGRFESALPYGHMGGHLAIADSDVTCYCGKKGCLEALVSSTGIVDAALRSGWQKDPGISVSVEDIFRAEQEGDPEAASIVDGFLSHLKTGIDNYINLFAPDIIIIGGGVSMGMGPYLDRLHVMDTLKPFKNYRVRMVLSELGDRSGILGSATLFHP
jgi:glucokinase